MGLELFIALVAALIWAAIIEMLHAIGWYPDRWLASLITRPPSLAALRTAFWGLVAVGALAAMAAAYYMVPRNDDGSAGNTIGNVTGNTGIITQGQKGDNSNPK